MKEVVFIIFRSLFINKKINPVVKKGQLECSLADPTHR